MATTATPASVTARASARWLPAAAVAASALALGARLFDLTWRYSSNVFFWDQWDYHNALLSSRDLWQLYNSQNGPVRLGVGMLLLKAVAEASRWNGRVEALVGTAVLFLGMLSLLQVKRMLWGGLALSDIAIPLVVLSTAQYEILVGTPSFAHVMSILVGPYVLAWLAPWRRLKYALIVALNFLLIYSAFGLFIAPLTIGLLVLDTYRAARGLEPERKDWSVAAAAAAGLAVALLSLYVFYRDLRFMPAVDCYRFPDPQPWRYVPFMGLMFSSFVGLSLTAHPNLSTAAGVALLALGLMLLGYHGRRVLREGTRAQPVSMVIVILLGYTLGVAAATAAGRLCVGLFAAQASRYTTYVIPGFLALYFQCLLLPWARLRPLVLALFLVVAGASWLPVASSQTLPASLPLPLYVTTKQIWGTCYLQQEDVKACDKAAGFRIYAWPDAQRFRAELLYMKQNRLGFYADGP